MQCVINIIKNLQGDKQMALDKILIAMTGFSYCIVAVIQLKKGSIPNAMIWAGYSFSQIGLWMALK